MTETDILRVSLSGEVAAQVREAIASGEYSSADEVVADALRSWQRELDEEDVEHLRAAWEEAVQDPRPRVEPNPVFDAVRARLTTRLSEQGRS